MRIKNLERAFEERIDEINSQLNMNLIGMYSYNLEKHFAEVALTQLKKKETYRIFNSHWGSNELRGYEHDKKLYSLVVDFARYANGAIQDIAQRLEISEDEVVSGAKLRSEQLKKRLRQE